MKKRLLLLGLILLLPFTPTLLLSQEEKSSSLQSEKAISPEPPLPGMENLPTPLPSLDYQKTFLKMIFSLIALLVLLIITFWAFRRLMKAKMLHGNYQQTIHILEKRSLSPKTLLYLVEVNKERVLIAESHLEVRKLHVLQSLSEEKPL